VRKPTEAEFLAQYEPQPYVVLGAAAWMLGMGLRHWHGA
jgi:hypothetical protein